MKIRHHYEVSHLFKQFYVKNKAVVYKNTHIEGIDLKFLREYCIEYENFGDEVNVIEMVVKRMLVQYLSSLIIMVFIHKFI